MNSELAASHFITAQDGLKLHVRSHGSRISSALPVFCLPGLARTTADFETLAVRLASDPVASRRVLALDSRGRGRSDYDPKAENYSLPVELADLIAVLTALGIARAVFVGTSRGGLLTMLLAAARPTALAGCVLNDVGPVVEMKGVVRIKSYVGKLPQPANFDEAAAMLRTLFGNQFPKLDDAEWLAFAHRTFKLTDGHLVPDYDPKLAATLSEVDIDKPLPQLWNAFDALARVPVMVIRGGNSDILSTATVEAMRARHPALEALEVPDQGHAPLLREADVMDRIAAFVARCEAGAPQ